MLFTLFAADSVLVGIAMRNFPEWIMAFWAINLIGAVPVLFNVWTTDEGLQHCFVKSDCKLAIVDWERAARLEPMLDSIRRQTALQDVIVARTNETKSDFWKDSTKFTRFEDVFTGSRAASTDWASDPDAGLEDHGVIFFTSGTTSLPKAVLSTKRAFMQPMHTVAYISQRNILRTGGQLPKSGAGLEPQRVQLGIAPLFHVAGCTSILVSSCTWA
jgi:acyl-CoA synthetase (AMP-forming)/AMP-acid ligase II